MEHRGKLLALSAGGCPRCIHSLHTQSILQWQVMWISHCGKPVSVCDGSDSDCWLMECGYITCVGECVHGGCNGHLYNPPPLSLSRVPVAQHKHHESQHQTLRSLWGAQTRRNQSSWLIVDYHETHCIRSLLTSAFYGPGSKVAPFAMGVRSCNASSPPVTSASSTCWLGSL